MKLMKRFLSNLYNYMEKCAMEEKIKLIEKCLIYILRQDWDTYHIVFKGNITIGANSYFNSGKISSGDKSSVKIGKWCAIGHNVNIHLITQC